MRIALPPLSTITVSEAYGTANETSVIVLHSGPTEIHPVEVPMNPCASKTRRYGPGFKSSMAAPVEILRLGREHLPVDARPPVGREHERDLIERKASGAPERDQRQAFEHAGIKHTTQAPPADRRDQPLFLVEP